MERFSDTQPGRIIKSGADRGVPLYYHYDGDAVVDYYSQAGVLQFYFINGPGTDETLYQGGGSSNWNFLTDGLGSNTSASTTAGTLQYTFTYDAFGRTAQSTTIRPRYTGQVRDWESDITYYKARYYDPTIGRFLSEDPFHFGGGDPNFYNYVGGNPVKYRDPTGKKKFWGNWCGPDWTGGFSEQYDPAHARRYKGAVDPEDEVCKNHDICYFNCRNNFKCDKDGRKACMVTCDRILVADMPHTFTGDWISPAIAYHRPDPGTNAQCGCKGPPGSKK